MKRHRRDSFFVVGEGILEGSSDGTPVVTSPSDLASLRKFRFSRLGPKGQPVDVELLTAMAKAMVGMPSGPPSEAAIPIPAGYTYLGQFIDHDLTLDKTAKSLGSQVTLDELVQGRSPALDLDSLYGRGPGNDEDSRFYSDGMRLKVGRTTATPEPGTNVNLDGFDLPRAGVGGSQSERRRALIPDERNDENLVVAQTHLAFIRFHNRVIDRLAEEGTPSVDLFSKARSEVVKHYQWMIRQDFLPRIADPAIVDDVFAKGRQFFEATSHPGDMPTMPLEFSVAAYRVGHSMIRGAYLWNRIFPSPDHPGGQLPLLFQFSGSSGNLSPDGDPLDPNSGSFLSLPTKWIADFRRLYAFAADGFEGLNPNGFNDAFRIDTRLTDPLKLLPPGSLGQAGQAVPDIERNLAFRNLMRANMVELASGQQMAELMSLPPLTRDQILGGNGGANMSALASNQKERLVASTPLWFYVLRESEFNRGRLAGVGARIVAEVFHRSIEGSQHSILRDPAWRPSLGSVADRFHMTDLLFFAFEGKRELLNPLGD